MTYHIKYRHLKAFLLAVETGSFSNAAELLGVTQPSFSALIRNLEITLGLKLFERTTRHIALTSEGIDLCDQIRRPLGDIEEAYRSMIALAIAKRSSIVMCALPSTALTLIPPTLGQLRHNQSNLRVRVIEAHNDELISLLRTNQVEFALGTLWSEFSDLKFLPLIEDVFCAVYTPTHPFAKKKQLKWKDLIPQDLIVLSKGSSARDLFEQSTASCDLEPGLRIDVTHMTTATMLVHQNLGVALLPKLALNALSLVGLEYQPISCKTAQRTIGLIQKRNRTLSPVGHAFVDELRKQAAHLMRKNISISANHISHN